MRILVAGSQGQVGSALVQQGLDEEIDLIALSHEQMDISNTDSINTAFIHYKPDILINAAGYTAVEKAESEPKLAYTINKSATVKLAVACKRQGIPMLHISTDYVFDGTKDGLYVETDPVNPISVYAKSKEAGERAIRERLERHIILRTSWVFGVQGSNFVKTIVRLAKDRDYLSVVADQFGGPSSARSIAKVLLGIAVNYKSSSSLPWGTYHFSQKPYVSWHQFAEAVVACAIELGLVDHTLQVIPIPSSSLQTLVKRPQNSRLDCSLLHNEFKNLNVQNWTDDLPEVILASYK